MDMGVALTRRLPLVSSVIVLMAHWAVRAAVGERRSGDGPVQPVDHARSGGLAGAVGAEKRGDLAQRYPE